MSYHGQFIITENPMNCQCKSEALREFAFSFVAELQESETKVAGQIGSHRALPASRYWNHVDRGNLVRHTVNTMMERAVALTLKRECDKAN